MYDHSLFGPLDSFPSGGRLSVISFAELFLFYFLEWDFHLFAFDRLALLWWQSLHDFFIFILLRYSFFFDLKGSMRFLLCLYELVLSINFIKFFYHLVEFIEILRVILPSTLIWFYFSHLQDGLSEIYVIHRLLLSAKILDKTYGLIFRIFRVLFFSPWNLLILRRQRRIVE